MSFPALGWGLDNVLPSRPGECTEENEAPVLDGIGNQAVDEGSQLVFTARATDPNDCDRLTFSLIGAPSGAAIGSASGGFT